MKTSLMFLPVAALGFAALAAWSQVTDSAQENAAEPAVRPVKLMVVEASERSATRQFFGKVAARKTVDLAFQVGGQVTQFPVIEGAQTVEGAVVAQLDLRPFELALEQARLQKEQADRTVDRLEKLRGNTVSQVTIDDAITVAGLAEIALENAEIALEDATLVAPFDALVASRRIENFTTINAGTPVVRLHDMSEIRVEIDVPEVLVQKAGLADNVEVMARFPASEQDYPMEVREMTAETGAVGQTFRVTLGMEPPEGLTLLPGSSVSVFTHLSLDGEGVIIPASAVQIDADGSTHVFLYQPKGAAEGTLTKVPVALTPTDQGQVRVVSGVSVGDEIVVAGVQALEDGMQARRFTGFGK